MKKIIIILCLALAGCATVSTNKVPPRVVTTKPAVVIDQKEIDSIIAVFSESIKKNPGYAGAYYNRAAAYFHKKDYDKCWQDIHKAEELGVRIDAQFIELVAKLKKASGRDR